MGRPASSKARAISSEDSGVSSAGLAIMGHPAASAAPNFRSNCTEGKFHGVIATLIPMGCLTTMIRLSGTLAGIVVPYARLPSSANQSMKPHPYAISPFACASGFPCSRVRISASSSTRSIMIAAARRRMCERSIAGMAAQPAIAASARSIESRMSSAVADATSATVSPVAGLSTAKVPFAPGSRHSPPM